MQRVVKTKMTKKEYTYNEVIKIVESKEAVYNLKDKGVNKEKKKRQYNFTKSWIKPQISLPPQLKKLSSFPKGLS